MKNQISASLARSQAGKSVLVAFFLCGLLGIAPNVAHTQDQRGVAGVPELDQVTPLAGVVSSTQNPNQIAILHWYGANQTTGFGVGTNPIGVAFDGSNIWVANDGGNVTKLRASDRAVQGTFNVGMKPLGVAFDGANIWVANLSSNSVSKL